jgi:hypothetical protein
VSFIFTVTAALSCVASLAQADVPAAPPTIATTRPTTRAMHAKKPVPKDWKRIENKTYHFYYFVPRTWKVDEHSDDLTNYIVSDAQGNQIGQVMVECPLGCHSATVEQAVKAQKEDDSKLNPGDKWISDEPTQFGDRDAWTYVTEKTEDGYVVSSKGVVSKVPTKMRFATWMSIDGQRYYEIHLFSEAVNYNRNAAFVQRMVGSLAWTAPPTTTQPAK